MKETRREGTGLEVNIIIILLFLIIVETEQCGSAGERLLQAEENL